MLLGMHLRLPCALGNATHIVCCVHTAQATPKAALCWDENFTAENFTDSQSHYLVVISN